MGTTRLPSSRMLHQQRQHAHEGHGAGNFAAGRAFERFLEVFERRRFDRLARRPCGWACTRPAGAAARAGRPSPGCRRAAGRTRRCARLRPGMGISKRELKCSISTSLSFFCWCDDVAAFAGFAQPVAFDGVGQHHGGAALGFDAPPCRRCRPSRIVAAAAAAASGRRRSSAPPGRAARGTCRRSAGGYKRRPW